MKLPLFVFLFLLICIPGFASNTTFEDFERGGFEKAQIRAKEEGKMLFLDFYASWCTPCKWMDETTLKDAEIKNLLETKFIAVKVNIDDFEGFELKSKFDIRFLPTILIFNAEGMMIERLEETLGTQKMRTMLNSHVQNTALVPPTHKVNTAPSDVFAGIPKNAEEVETNTVTTTTNLAETTNETESNLVSETTYMPEKSSYKMQLGVYSSLDRASNHVEELKKIFMDDITIVQLETDGKIMYRVLLGDFSSLSEAKSFKTILAQQFGMNSIIF